MATVPFTGVQDNTIAPSSLPAEQEQKPYVYEAAFGKGLGASLDTVAQGLDKIDQANGAAQAAKATADLSNGVNEATIKNQQNADPYGKGYVDQQTTSYDQLFQNAKAALPTDFTGNANPYALEALQKHAQTQRAMVVNEAMQWQANQAVDGRTMDLQSASQGNANNLSSFSDPKQADAALDQVNNQYGATVDSSLLAPNLKQKLKMENQKNTAMAVGISWVDKDAAGYQAARNANQIGTVSTDVDEAVNGNNNPGNLRGNDDWQGKTGVDDNGFVQFSTPEDGKRALQIDLQNQQKLHGLNTVQDIISKYAPSSDNNNTSAYVNNVSSALGVKPDQPIDLSNKATLDKMTTAVTKQEGNGSGSGEAATGSDAGDNVAAPNFTKYLTPEELHQLDNRAQEQVNKQQRVAQTDLATDTKNAIAQAQNGVVNAGGNIPLSQFEAAHPGQGQDYYNSFQRDIQWGQNLHSAVTQTPDQQAAAVASVTPKPGDENYAVLDNDRRLLENAQIDANNARNKDPIQTIGINNNLLDPSPLPISDTNKFIQQLGQQQSATIAYNKSYGTPPVAMSQQQAATVTAQLEKMPADQRASVLENMGDALTDPNVFRATMAQIGKGSPVMAQAAMYMNADKVQVSNPDYATAGFIARTFGNVPATIGVDGQQAASLALRGQDLINPTKLDKQDAGSAKPFPMPADANDTGKPGIRNSFDVMSGGNPTTNEGSIFAGRPDGYDQSYQTYKSIYAAMSADAGDYSGVTNADRAARAAKIALGDITQVNGKAVAPPWGMSASDFQDKAMTLFNTNIAPTYPAAGKWRGTQLINSDTPGKYGIKTGTGMLTNPQTGRPVLLDISAPVPRIALQHASAPVTLNGDVPDDLSGATEAE